MSESPFVLKSGLVVVKAEITGSLKSLVVNLVVDTGATTSLIDPSLLRQTGLMPDVSARHVGMMTGSGVESVPVVILTRLTAIGRHRFGFPVIAHSLPPGSGPSTGCSEWNSCAIRR